MTSRRLEQVHPPSAAESDASDTPDIEISATSPGRWEGTVRLDDGRTAQFVAHRDGQQVHVWIAGETYVFTPPAPITRARCTGQAASDDIVCPVPGVVIAVHVAADDTVEAGQDLVIIESMKTEQIVKSPRDGVVQRVSVQEGDRVDRGMRLVVLVAVDGG
jgi:3-methylcrotonyl-CoA carboxylase alpha subunit